MPAAHNNKTRSEGKKIKLVWGQTTVTHPAVREQRGVSALHHIPPQDSFIDTFQDFTCDNPEPKRP